MEMPQIRLTASIVCVCAFAVYSDVKHSIDVCLYQLAQMAACSSSLSFSFFFINSRI